MLKATDKIYQEIREFTCETKQKLPDGAILKSFA